MRISELPLANYGYLSYRYRGRYGWVMIGAKNDADALIEAQRSCESTVSSENLEVWSTELKKYVPVK